METDPYIIAAQALLDKMNGPTFAGDRATEIAAMVRYFVTEMKNTIKKIGGGDIPMELVPTEVMLEELGRRHEVMVFGGVKLRAKTNSETQRYIKGEFYPCAGLCVKLQSDIMDKMHASLLREEVYEEGTGENPPPTK